jgi:hypothetical protein
MHYAIRTLGVGLPGLASFCQVEKTVFTMEKLFPAKIVVAGKITFYHLIFSYIYFGSFV